MPGTRLDYSALRRIRQQVTSYNDAVYFSNSTINIYSSIGLPTDIHRTIPHATATVNGVQVAETDTYEVVDGNIYFPPDSITQSHFTPTSTKTHCPYKGDASYYTITTNKTEVKDAAWYYPAPLDSMKKIKGYVAFYKGKAEVKSS